MPNTVQGLVLRIPNGAPLSAAQGDNNFQILANFSDQLAAAISVSLNPNGTLTNGALSLPAQIGNIPLIADSLNAGTTLPTSTFNGFTNTYAVPNGAIVAYVKGMKFQFVADQPNTGAALISINGLGSIGIVKGVSQPLAANDITTGMVVELVFDGTSFQLIAMASPFIAAPQATTSVFGQVQLAIAAEVAVGTDASKAITSAALKGVYFTSTLQVISNTNPTILSVAHGLPAVPSFVRWVLVNQSIDLDYAPGDEVDCSNVVGLTGATTIAGAYTQVTNATSALLIFSCANSQAIPDKTLGGCTHLDVTKWKAKCYAGIR